jgi:hypothetical protein
VLDNVNIQIGSPDLTDLTLYRLTSPVHPIVFPLYDPASDLCCDGDEIGFVCSFNLEDDERKRNTRAGGSL